MKQKEEKADLEVQEMRKHIKFLQDNNLMVPLWKLQIAYPNKNNEQLKIEQGLTVETTNQ